MNSKNVDLLKGIGLTDSEIKVYLALLELGSSSKGSIVQKSSVASSKVYELLNKLIDKGLASSVIKSGVKYFEAAPPSRILDYMKDKEKALEEQQEELKKIIPFLESKRIEIKGSETQVFRGMKGAETAFNDILADLKQGEEYHVLGVSAFTPHFERFVINFHKRRAAAGIKCKLIVNELTENIGKQFERIKLTKVKYVQKELFTPVVFIIYKEKTLISIGLDEVFIQVKSKNLSEGLKSYFNYLWNQETTIIKGMENVKVELFKMLDEVKAGGGYDVLGAAFGEKGVSEEYQKLFREFHPERIKRNVHSRLLFQRGYEDYLKKNKSLYYNKADTRFMPYKLDSPVAIFSTDKKARLMIQKKEPVLITLNNKEIADAFKKQFESLWNQDTSITKGIKSLNNALNDYVDNLEPGETYNVLGVTFGHDDYSFHKKDYSEAFRKSHEKRVGKGIKARLLFQQKDKAMIDKYLKNIYGKNVESKILPYRTEYPVAMLTSKNQIIMTIHGKEPTIITIKNKQAAQAFMSHFESLWNQESRVVRGLDAVQDIFDDMLSAGHCDFIGARGYFMDHRPKYIDSWIKKAKESGFTMRNIVDPSAKGHRITTLPFAETKYTLQEEFAELSMFWIYCNKVVISNWAGSEPILTIIENKQIFDMYKKQFELLWKKDKV